MNLRKEAPTKEIEEQLENDEQALREEDRASRRVENAIPARIG